MTKLNKISDSLSYEKGNVIGRGSYGLVYRGYFNNKEVAIKKIDLDALDEKDMEIETHLELDHENVVKILTVEKDEFFQFIVLEFCAGSLEQVIHNEYNGPTLPPDIMVFNQIANGLDYIHSKRIIHCDIKPSNILISIENSTIMKWADFGLSVKLTTQDSSSMSGMKGTTSWMAPELLRKTKRLSFKCDIFSTGLVFAVFLTHGIHPFGNEANVYDYFERKGNIIKNNPVNLHRLDSEHFAAGIISEMIKDDPAERPSSAKLKQDLETLIQNNKKNSNSPNNILNISSYFAEFTATHCIASHADSSIDTENNLK